MEIHTHVVTLIYTRTIKLIISMCAAVWMWTKWQYLTCVPLCKDLKTITNTRISEISSTNEFDRRAEPGRRNECVWGGKKKLIFSYSLTVAAPDLLDPKSAAHNTNPCLSFTTKPFTKAPQQEREASEASEESEGSEVSARSKSLSWLSYFQRRFSSFWVRSVVTSNGFVTNVI